MRSSRVTGRPGTTSSATTPRCVRNSTELEERARRRDLLVGDDEIYAFYDARIPPTSVSARHFDAWWKKQRHKTPDLLTLTRDDLLRNGRSSRPTSRTRGSAGDLSLPVTLPVRAGRRRRRCHGARAGRGAGPPRRRRVRLAGTGAARGTGHRADQLAAKGPAPQLRSRTRHRPGRAGRRSTPGRRAAAGGPAARTAAAHRRAGPDRRVRPRQAAAAPAGHVRRRVRRRHRGGSRQGSRGAAGQLAAPIRQAVAEAVAGDAGTQRVCAPGPTTSTSCRAPSRRTSGGPPGAGLPGTRRRGRRGGRAGVRRRRPSRLPRWGRAPADCCGWPCRRR